MNGASRGGAAVRRRAARQPRDFSGLAAVDVATAARLGDGDSSVLLPLSAAARAECVRRVEAAPATAAAPAVRWLAS